MNKSIKVAPKKRGRGRPATGGRDPHITIRMPELLIVEADAWATSNEMTRSEAIRRLIEIGLKAAPALRENVLSAGPTARDLAAAQIDRMVDADASADEQAVRKRRLLKGPPEFRDSRVDVEQRQWGVVGKKKPPGPANSK
jgi:hypothetical protein